MKKSSVAALALVLSLGSASAQKVQMVKSTENGLWQTGQAKLSKTADNEPLMKVSAGADGTKFKAWGMTFNELDWDALCMLTRQEQDEILRRMFAPDGDLRFNRGRISPGANDYARSWFSCDEVPGDFELRYFNIDRDKKAIIPFIRAAQHYNPDLTCWISPWSPPSWMKIHGDYPVVSSKYNNLPEEANYLLFSGVGGEVDEDEMKLTGARDGQFPRQLATTDYMIQDPRYLKAYAEYFCKFIDAYKEQGIPIDMVIYQNEAYSYTPYPGCAWTAAGTVRFNKEYLAPALKSRHPDVKLYLGTFNTNRQDHVEQILSDKDLCDQVSGIAFQWEGRDILAAIREQHPEWSYICSESECGWGSFDWKAAEHTFELINHYLGNGCDEYNIWNCILTDSGESPWGWKQNALIRVDSKARTFEYSPEYYAVKHYSNFIPAGSKIVGYHGAKADQTPVLAAVTPDNRKVVMAGNFNDEARSVTVEVDGKYLNLNLDPHSMSTVEIGR